MKFKEGDWVLWYGSKFKIHRILENIVELEAEKYATQFVHLDVLSLHQVAWYRTPAMLEWAPCT